MAVLERRLLYGGGLGTVEVTKPGFYHQLHSVNHFNITRTPWYRDLELATRVRYVTPRYDFAQPHRDGTALVFSRYIDETCASIARFSPKDARTYREWNAKADVISDCDLLAGAVQRAAARGGARRAALPQRASAATSCRSSTGSRSPSSNELFENELVRLLLLFKMSLFGTVLYDQVSTRSPMGALVRGFDLVANYQVAIGGSHALARGLMEAFVRAGGHFRSGAHVDRIVVDGNRATGVELADGTVLRARQFVASTVDVPQTFTRMVGLDQLPPAYQDKVRSFEQTAWSLFGVHLALKEAPRHVGRDFDPHVDESLKVNVGCESMKQLFALHDEVAAGKIPSRVSFGTGSVTQFDPSQAPAGHATAYAWHAMPYAPGGDPANIEAVKEEFADRMLDTWREWAPNMTPDNVLARHVYTANDYTHELINMVEGDIFMGSFAGHQTMWNHFGYRTPVQGLYMAGSPTHPGGAISGGGGYIAARVIAEDLGLPLWWEPVDARATMEKLATAGGAE